ncbi:MAG: calcium-binding protein [Cypionkella sp.]
MTNSSYIGSATADVHMINIAVTAADGCGLAWQDAAQMIPLGMNGNPEAFVAAIQGGLPLVNNLRVLFNEYSFNPDGSLNPQFERFLAAAAAAGYQITLAYGSGDTQNLGIGDANHPSLSNAEGYDALQQNFTKVQDAWGQMMDWMDGHSTVKDAVYGWDLMNEAAAYRHTIKANGSDATYSATSFVDLYATHCADLAQMIEARASGHILVGGWGFNGDFLTLANANMGATSALDYLRTAIGPELVWSAHLYPGWMGTNSATDPTSLMARLDEIFGALKGDNVLVTETNIDGAVDDAGQAIDSVDLFAASFSWFAENGIGLGWYPGAQTGSSHLIYVENDGSVTIRHQHSLAHALDAFSLGEVQPQHDGNEVIRTVLADAALRNEGYEVAAGEALFDALHKMGTAFGFGGDDTLQGTTQSNDFLYGGSGNDVLMAAGGDDFLFGQGDDDRLLGGSGFDHLFGGAGNDTLDAGGGVDLLVGGAGDDLYIVRTARDMIREFAGDGVDQVNTLLKTLSLQSGNATQYANIENLNYVGLGDFHGIGNGLDNHLWGAAGADTIFGAFGADTLEGMVGNDSMAGGQGADLLLGQAGNDTLIGGPDADTLVGGAGADRLFGGDGADVFIFDRGHDVIFDFSATEDAIVFHTTSQIKTVADLVPHAQDVAGNVVFDFGPADGLVVRGITLADLMPELLLG